MKKCDQCGVCCTLFLINLSKKEYYTGLYKTELEKFGLIENFKLASECGANIIKQKKDGSCYYLKKNKCSIHKIRPNVCREFFCVTKSKKFKKMVDLIKAKINTTKKHIHA